MTLLQAFSIVCVVSLSTNLEAHILDARIQNPRMKICTKPNDYLSCSPSCKGRLFCKDEYELTERSCPEDAPFCDPYTLNCTKSETTVKTDFQSITYTQDLLNCRNFLYRDNEILLRYTCTDNLKFDPKENKCKESNDCIEFNKLALCKNHEDEYLPYYSFSDRFVYCGINNNPNLLKCPDYTLFNPVAQSCQFYCKHEGLNPDPLNRYQFYNCTRKKNTLEPRKEICPNDFIFDRNVLRCIPITFPEQGGLVENVCGLHNTRGVLSKCRIDYASTAEGILDPSRFNKNLIVSCFVDAEPNVIYYDCENDKEIVKDCAFSGHDEGIIDGCTVGPCFKLYGNFTVISYDCRNLFK